ncbi:hypothetical protein PV08_03744 [Exophiala spinifera]|uniref:Major facilitator superfamily (MFS) profile domain-containing protein n=1 Tax=Exophiala spinifera TaxID=91928 RepID=A0A0D1YNB6_9EURO|nr:uncharacterized protein PV08_03744 [Exophiala spinifera]KIW16556.1 hypothetical protein PV08_03744 [Exophiala spinifera]
MMNNSDAEAAVPPSNITVTFPPGTKILEDGSRNTGHGDGHLVFIPTPSDDPDDPLNWSKARKYINFGIISWYTFMIFVILDVGGVCWGIWVELWNTTFNDLNNIYGANLAGLAMGCVLFIPFALKYGRRVVYIFSVTVTLACTIWMSQVNGVVSLVLANLFSGLAGAVSEALVQMTVADIFFVHERGTFNGIYLIMTSAGAYLGPVASGYMVDGQGWRWLYYWCTIGIAISFISIVFFYEETKFVPALTGQSSTPNPSQIQEPLEDAKDNTVTSVATRTSVIDYTKPMKTYRQRMALFTTTPGSLSTFLRHGYQPFIVLFTIPSVFLISIIYSGLLAWLSLILVTETAIFNLPPYSFSASAVGLLYLAGFTGSLIGAVYGGPLSDWSIVYLAKRNGGIYEPEMRLYMSLFPMILGPGGIFLYGYTATNGMHWIIPNIGVAIFAFSLVAISDNVLTYLLDSYSEILGDILTSLAFVRNGMSTLITFTCAFWIDSLGYQKTILSFGFLALATNLLLLPMIFWGKKLRIMSAPRYARMAAQQFDPRAI